jgi:predicted nucleic acid-binding protein
VRIGGNSCLNKVLVDTNIYAADEMGYPDAVEILEQFIDDEVTIIMTSMVKMEIMCHYEIETVEAIKSNREGYLQLADEIYHVSEEELRIAAEIRRLARADALRKKSIKAPDAIIAASALIHQAKLISNNDRDFNWIRDHRSQGTQVDRRA